MFVLCTHLTATTVSCDTNPPAGTPCIRICKNGAGTAGRVQIRNLHSSAHGQLIDAGVPPAGFDAIFDFEHDTSGTQSPGTVSGDWVPWSGGTMKIRVIFSDGGTPTVIDLESDAPGSC